MVEWKLLIKKKKNAPWRRYRCFLCGKIIVHNWRKRHALQKHKGKTVLYNQIDETLCNSDNPYKYNKFCVRKKGHKGLCSDEKRHKGK